MDVTLLKVGALAKKTGLTVRALHYYEEIGLLVPAQRSEKGYRLYGLKEVQRLQKIVSLQQLGFSLEDIKLLLDQPDYSLQNVLQLHMIKLEEQIQIQQRLYSRLKTVSEHLQTNKKISVDVFLRTIKETTMHEKYYTPEQLETLKKRGEEMGEKGMQEAQTQWADLNNAFRAAMEQDTDPADEQVQALVAQMQQLINAFTGGDPAIKQSLGKMYKEEGPEKASRGAVDKALFEYVGKARTIFESR